MGYTSLHRDKGLTNQEFFATEFPNMHEDHEVVANATVGGTYYAAMRNKETGETWALVILTQWAPKSYYNFTYKEMDETVGPNEAQAPAKVLNALTATDHEWAKKWREACRANIAKKQEAKKIKVGDTVKFAEPMEFTNGYKGDTFVFCGRNTFRAADAYFRVRIQNWRTYSNYEVVAKAAA